MAAKLTRADAPRPTTNAAATTDYVCDVMSTLCRDLSIEQLLCRPLMAVEMALAVGLRQGSIGTELAGRAADAIGRMRALNPDLEGVIHDVCRIALNSRKRGDLTKDKY